MKEIFSEKQIEAYSLALLRWAYGKTGDRSQAEDLAQEVWMQLYHSVRNGAAVQPKARRGKGIPCRHSLARALDRSGRACPTIR